MSLREDLLGLEPDTKVVETRAGAVLVRGFTLRTKDRVQLAALNGQGWRGIIVQECALDPETHEQLFGPDDIPALNDLPADPEAIVDAATELSAMSAAELEELEGN